MPPKGVVEDLRKASEDMFDAFSRVETRMQWAKLERERKKREEDQTEKERRMGPVVMS